MPYKKKRRKPGYGSCAKMVYGDAQKALKVALGVKRLLNIEIKNFDVQQTGTTLNSTPSIQQLSNIPQGDTTITRDGAQCKVIGIDFKYLMNQNASATLTFVRIMLILDKQTNQAIYAAGDLLEDVTTTDAIVSPRNLDNKRRFTVLYDRVHTFQDSGTSTVNVKKFIKKDLILRFDGSTPSIADLTQNSLSLFQVSNEPTNAPAITSFVRLRYVDN